MLEDIAVGLQKLAVVVAVGNALVNDELAVDVFVVHDLAVAVDLVGVPLRAEGNEDRQRTEVVYVVEDGPQTQRAHVGDDHGAVKGTGLDQRIGDQPEIIQRAQDRDRKAEQEARGLRKRLGDLFGVVVLFAGLDLLDLRVELAVYVEDRVGGLEVHLDRGLGRVDGQRALDRHDNGDVVMGVDAPTSDEAVDARQHRDAADMRGDEEVQHPDTLVAVHTQLAQAAVDG